METFVQALIMAFREGLEAFLIIVILLKFIDKTGAKMLKKNVWYGTLAGVGTSFVFGLILIGIAKFLGGTDATAKLWESGASFVAVLLVSTFIVWMIKHGGKIRDHVEKQASLNLSEKGIFLLALFMVAREGVEIAMFAFAGKYAVLPIVLGVLLSLILAVLIYHSLVRIKLKTIFTITLAYLILQAGFLLGYSIHEGLSAAKDSGLLEKSNPIYTKAFDLSKTVLNHKEGILGLPLYVTFGWYSKPEWIQFLVQYGYSALFFIYWFKRERKLVPDAKK
jgi:high-affinity iron transporter